MTMKLMTTARKALLAGVALSACLGFTLNAQAQTCTVNNWASTTGLGDADTGTQGATNRRYGGPCGLQVDIDGTARFVTDDSPANEATYIARFYVFLDNAGSDPVQIFGADDGTNDQIQVWYNSPATGDLTLRVFDKSGNPSDLVDNVGSGWHSVEFTWSAGDSAEILYSVDGASDISATVDTDGLAIANAHLGNVTGASGGSIDFDDFDSRRMDRPGRLMVGDANDDGAVSAVDLTSVLGEINATSFAAGQPDCNEDGSITASDLTCTLGVINQ